ncbi:hypothetical protein H257_19160 [Aphanomyces astaci]|uniref:DDE Tnp4 domain-containing protein n=1 Tax=Aphanomyces astaci TaxID=112090 RepID=W4FB12_APHAT|nr:hypothetical protein H257_19160 [Aphanomyces astaci]ETV63913.1 hypothetical protein H257_19160 [Aphanomyces astaci]|eukprot:XP_009846609.1 hypothetical protein H257_19160 [Aphanomyces astaci]
MSRPLIDLLKKQGVLAPGVCVAADTAFPVKNGNYSIVTPLKSGDHEAVTRTSNAITSLRQAAEWGMGSAPNVYRALALPLPYNPSIRARRLSTIYRLYNFRFVLLFTLVSFAFALLTVLQLVTSCFVITTTLLGLLLLRFFALQKFLAAQFGLLLLPLEIPSTSITFHFYPN